MPNENGGQLLETEKEVTPPHASQVDEGVTESSRQNARKPQKYNKPPIWEWIVAFVGLMLVVSAVGFMLYRALKGNSSPPEITISIDSVTTAADGFLVTFRAINRGEVTAAGLTVKGELRSDSETIETSTATLNYVPSRSERRGGLFFTNDPRKFEIKLRAKGYERP